MMLWGRPPGRAGCACQADLHNITAGVAAGTGVAGALVTRAVEAAAGGVPGGGFTLLLGTGATSNPRLVLQAPTATATPKLPASANS